MCCFTQPIELVADTHIFARSGNGRQYLVYSMTFAAVGDLAMVLPLPVPRKPREDAVRFINLERYADFFDDMHLGFPTRGFARSLHAVARGAPQLKVHDVGCFEASFVPQTADFDRLDERFRIPDDVWAQLPIYCDYGFAVFKLKGGLKRQDVHPMAFEFPRRNPELLYFPTVHIHDRQVHSDAQFDHMLYCQAGADLTDYLEDWRQSNDIASAFMDIDRTEGIVDPNLHCWRRALEGQRENADTLVGKNGSIPAAV
jgi:hypothetical protein